MNVMFILKPRKEIMSKFPKIVAYITLSFIVICMAFSFIAATSPQRFKRGIYFIDKVPIVYQLTESSSGTLYVNNSENLPQTYNLVYEVVTSDGKCHVVVMPNAIK